MTTSAGGSRSRLGKSRASVAVGRHGRIDYQSWVENISDFKRAAGQCRGIQRKKTRYVNFISSAPRPGISPDVFNAAFQTNDVKAILVELRFEARVHGTELINIIQTSPALTEHYAVTVGETFHPRLHKRGRADSDARAIWFLNANRQTAGRKAKWNEGTLGGTPRSPKLTTGAKGSNR